MSQHDNLQDADGENLNATPPNTESTENTDASTEPVKQPILAGDSSEAVSYTHLTLPTTPYV